MAKTRIPVSLEFDAAAFSGQYIRIQEAGRAMNAYWELTQATWEPHDWAAL